MLCEYQILPGLHFYTSSSCSFSGRNLLDVKVSTVTFRAHRVGVVHVEHAHHSVRKRLLCRRPCRHSSERMCMFVRTVESFCVINGVAVAKVCAVSCTVRKQTRTGQRCIRICMCTNMGFPTCKLGGGG